MIESDQAPMPPAGAPRAPPGLSLLLVSTHTHSHPLYACIQDHPHTALCYLVHHMYTACAHLAVFLGIFCLAAAIPNWRLRHL